METGVLREQLIHALYDIYDLNAFSTLGDLLQGEMLVLHGLLLAGDAPVYPSVLSETLHLSRSRMTAALSSLRRKELVELEPSETDRRRVHVRLTAAGAAVIGEKLRRMAAYFDRMIAGLGETDAAALIALIERCVDVMNTAEEDE